MQTKWIHIEFWFKTPFWDRSNLRTLCRRDNKQRFFNERKLLKQCNVEVISAKKE